MTKHLLDARAPTPPAAHAGCPGNSRKQSASQPTALPPSFSFQVCWNLSKRKSPEKQSMTGNYCALAATVRVHPDGKEGRQL